MSPDAIVQLIVQLPMVGAVVTVFLIMLKRQDRRDREASVERAKQGDLNRAVYRRIIRVVRKLDDSVKKLGSGVQSLDEGIHSKHLEIRKVLREVLTLECHPVNSKGMLASDPSRDGEDSIPDELLPEGQRALKKS